MVLSAVPLIITALKGYQNLGKTRDKFKRKSLHLGRMIRALDGQQKLILSDVKLVLRNAGLDEMMIDQEVDNCHYQDLFKRPGIQSAVVSVLGDNYSTYLETLHECEITILGVARAVTFFKEDSWVSEEQHFHDKSLTRQVANGLAGVLFTKSRINRSGNEFWRRVKFSMNKDDLESSINEIDKLSSLLERLREKSQQYHQFTIQSSSSSTRAVVSMLRKVQIRALRLHKALAQSWAQSCHDPHGARLYLDARVDKFEACKKFSAPYKQNNIEFSITLQNCTNQSYHTCVVEALSFDDFKSFSTPTNPAVSFQMTSNAVGTPNRSDVDNICHVLNHCMNKKNFLRLYLVENERLCYEHVSSDISTHSLSHAHDEKMVSLQRLLQDPAYKRTMQLRPRVKLAAMMASTALQLHSTPWCRNLRNETMLFVQDLSGQVDLGNPFVACTIHGNCALSSSCPAQSESELLDLGILILELWHNQTIDAFARDSGLAFDDTFDVRRSVARKWISETKDDLLPSFYDAAVRCINCRFDTVDVDLTDHKLNISIFEGVVKPLWENCRA